VNLKAGYDKHMEFTVRKVNPGDEEFLYRMHKATMLPYVENTWGPWDDEWQRTYFHDHFLPDQMTVIQIEGQDVGVMRVQERTEEIYLAILEILPEFQNRGIGTAVIQTLLKKANQQGKPVALKVLKVNLPARSLYQRLGFGVTGEDATHYIMAYEKKGTE
jgi:ribosomal protein S18 acetylase RimI-like enzyme